MSIPHTPLAGTPMPQSRTTKSPHRPQATAKNRIARAFGIPKVMPSRHWET